MNDSYEVQLFWDSEAEVWVATSNDILGLILEDCSVDKLIKKVRLAAPEIIELNHLNKRNSIHFSYEVEESLVSA